MSSPNDVSKSYQIVIPNFPIRVNGKPIDNSTEPYPIFTFRGVTYFPLTWHFAVDEFGWQSDFSVEQGLKVTSAKGNDMEGMGPDRSAEIESSGTLIITRVDLQKEEVDIQNAGTVKLNLEGYTLKSVTGGQSFVFPSYVLEADEMVTVYARGGSGDLKWSGNYIWNNDGDPAELYSPSNVLVDVYK